VNRGPGFERVNPGSGSLLARGFAGFSGLTRKLALDVIEHTDHGKGLPRDLGFGCAPDIMKVTPQMGPAGCVAHRHGPRCVRFLTFL